MSTTHRLTTLRLLLLALLVGLLRVGWGPVLAAQADPFFGAVCHAGQDQPGTEHRPSAGHCPACLGHAWALTPFVDPRWQAASAPGAAQPQPPARVAHLPARHSPARARAPPRA